MSSSFEVEYDKYLREHFFAGVEPDPDALQHHLTDAEARLRRVLIPWIDRLFPLEGSRMLEIGCGTGASTAPFVDRVSQVTCFEIVDRIRAAAKKRAELREWANVRFFDEPFGEHCAVARDNEEFDIVLFAGVLEHMSFDVFQDVLGCAFRLLREGGIIVVFDTPNRLSVIDYHTSKLHFFQQLPEPVRSLYFDRSPRDDFVRDLRDILREKPFAIQERLQDWGTGLSYHDFELVLGSNIHNMIIADGWEEQVREIAHICDDDDWLQSTFQRFNVPAHRAFARGWLTFIMQK